MDPVAYLGQDDCIMHRYALVGALLACGPSLPQIPPALVDDALCALEATLELPRDPDQVTLGQAKDLARALRDCEASDAGAR